LTAEEQGDEDNDDAYDDADDDEDDDDDADVNFFNAGDLSFFAGVDKDVLSLVELTLFFNAAGFFSACSIEEVVVTDETGVVREVVSLISTEVTGIISTGGTPTEVTAAEDSITSTPGIAGAFAGVSFAFDFFALDMVE
jgi:hypothetical protein